MSEHLSTGLFRLTTPNTGSASRPKTSFISQNISGLISRRSSVSGRGMWSNLCRNSPTYWRNIYALVKPIFRSGHALFNPDRLITLYVCPIGQRSPLVHIRCIRISAWASQRYPVLRSWSFLHYEVDSTIEPMLAAHEWNLKLSLDHCIKCAN